ncbi:MAG: Gfo/Idh/MocA family oxidoreductase [Planctomycetaceae bacterium]|jgi:predicted dehydrogenase|nr:Gfo/Idh/MocA family oxidoreductase [Planctomycetaceae bacterium]
MSKKILNVGMLGAGFMGRTHSNAYCQVNHFFNTPFQPVLKACYGREEDIEATKKFQEYWGYESIETDWKKLINRPDIDIVDVVAPNFLHKEMVLEAAKAGKKIICEKPLAMSYAEAQEMVAAVEKAGVPNMVSFNYRRVPAISLIKQVVDEGRIGRPFHYRALYLQDYTISTKVPAGGAALWRLSANIAGSGVTGDLLAHSIDTAEWLNGPIARVCAYTEIFVKERVNQETGEKVKITIDDACMFLAVFANGSIGTFESSRYARGRKNYNTLEINGELGAAAFNLEQPEYIEFFRYADPVTGQKIEDHLTGWQKILVTNGEHPYMKNYWVPGTTIGYEHTFINGLADFLLSLDKDTAAGAVHPVVSVRQAARTQLVCDSVIKSAKDKTWVEI